MAKKNNQKSLVEEVQALGTEEKKPQGIKLFLQDALTRTGNTYSDEKADKIISKFNNDYDKIIEFAGNKAGIKDKEVFKTKVYDRYNLPKPSKEELAEREFIQKPIATDIEKGYERYSQLQEELKLARGLETGLKPKELPEEKPTVARDVTRMETSKMLEEEFLTPEQQLAKQQEAHRQTRLYNIQTKIEDINKIISEQADINLKNLGYVSEEHEKIAKQYDDYSKILNQTIQEAKERNKRDRVFGISDRLIQYTPEEENKIRNLENIKEMYAKMGKILSSPQGKDFGSQMTGLYHGFTDNFFTRDFATLGLTEMGRLMNVKEAFDTQQDLKKQGKTDEEIAELMPVEQRVLLDTYKLFQNIQAGNKGNFGTTIGEGLKEMIPFIAQFAATGGVGEGAKKLVKEFIEAKTKSALTGRIAGAVSKPLVQAAIMIPAELQNYAQRVAPTMDEQGNLIEGAEPINAAFKAFLSTAAEVAGEDIGVFTNKWANKAARKNFAKMITNNPTKSQQFLGKLSLAITRETNMSGIQGLPFEVTGEEATGLMQAAIDQDGSFFTPEAQAQIWTLSLMASGSFAVLSTPQRLAVRRSYKRSVNLLNDIPNEQYAKAVEDLSLNYDDPVEAVEALNSITKEFQVSKEDFLKARVFIGNTIAYNQMNTARAIQVEQRISQAKGNDGNVTLTEYNGESYSVRNPENLGEPGKIVYLQSKQGKVIPVISSKISKAETQTPEDIIKQYANEQDSQDDIIEQGQKVQEEANQRGLQEGKTVNTPSGKRTLVTININGTAVVEDNKGEQTTVNTDEIEAYKTQEQKDAEKAQAEADLAILEGIEEGAEVVSDEPLTEDSDIRVIDFSNGQSKIITPEGESVFNTKEDRDNAIQELVSGEIETAEASLDEMSPEEAFASMRQEDPEIANEIFLGEIESLKQQAEESRAKVSETSSRKEKQNLLLEAKRLESEAARLEEIYNDPTLLEVEEEVAEKVPEEVRTEQQIFDTADDLAREFEQEKEMTPANQLLPWQQELLRQKVNPDSFNRWGDPNNITQGLARAWFTKKGEGTSSNDIDTIAEELGVDPSEVAEFITNNPTGTVRTTTDRMNEIRKEYKELTGRSIDTHKDLRESLGIQVPIAEPVEVEGFEDAVPVEEVPFRSVETTEMADQELTRRQKSRVKPTLDKLVNQFGIPVQIIHSSEMPEHVKRAAAGKNINAIGFYDPSTGVAYILSDKVGGIAELKKTYLHEAILHKGLDVLFDQGPVIILDKVFNTKTDLLEYVFDRMDIQTLANRAKEYSKDIFDNYFEFKDGKYSLKKGMNLNDLPTKIKTELAEEALATLNETESPRLQVILDKIYNWIKKVLGLTSKQFSKADLRQLLKDHRDLIIKQKRDAETIREDERQVQETRDVRQEVEAISGEDIQQQKEAVAETSEEDRVKFRTTEELPAFKRWNDYNPVVTPEESFDYDFEAGQPVTVMGYHGSPNEFFEFDITRLGEQGRAEGSGFYFTPDKRIAEAYQGKEGYLIDAFIKFDKPLLYDTVLEEEELREFLDKLSELEIEQLLEEDEELTEEDAMWSTTLANYGSIEDAIDIMMEDSASDVMGDLISAGAYPELVNRAITESIGYDGILSRGFGNEGGSMIYVPFTSNQIKLATGENTTFDESSPDIRFRAMEGIDPLRKETTYDDLPDNLKKLPQIITPEEKRQAFREYGPPTTYGPNPFSKKAPEIYYDDFNDGIPVAVVPRPQEIRDEIIRRQKEATPKFKVEEERNKVETDPSDKQKEAGNYKKGHIKIDGFDISIENPVGSIRKGKDEKGNEWSSIMPADYGYFKGTIGKDKDHIDVYIGDNLDSDKVYIVDQVNPNTGQFDEHKVMMGFNSISDARKAYLEAYEEGWTGLGAITRTTKDGLKKWFKGDTKKPYALKEDIRFRVTSEDPEIQKMLDRLQAIQKASKAGIEKLEEEKKSAKKYTKEMIQNKINILRDGIRTGRKEAKETISEIQKAITEYAKANIPLSEAGAREISSLLTIIKSSQTPQSLINAYEKIDNIVEETSERSERNKAVAKVNRILKWMTGLKKSGQKRVGKFNYEETRAFQELKDIDNKTIEFARKIRSNKSAALEKVDAENGLNELWDSINEKENKTALDETILKLIDLRRLGSKASSTLAQTVYEELETLYSAAKDSKSQKDLDKAMTRKESKEFVKDFLTGGDKALADKSWFRRAMTQLNTKVADIMGNWETILTMIGGTELRDKYSLMLSEAQMELGKQESINNILDQAKTIYGAKSKTGTLNKLHELSDKKYELRQPNRQAEAGEGKPMKLSKLELMDIYNAIKNDVIANDYYMSYGDITLDEEGNRDTDAQYASGLETITILLSNLDETDKLLATSMQEELDKYYNQINEVHIKLYNRDLPRVDNYWPSTVEREQDIDVVEQFSSDYRYPSATKERTAHRTPKPGDAFSKFIKHVNEAEWFTQMGLNINEINKTFKDNNVKTLIQDARGTKFYNQISDAIKNVGLGVQNKQYSELNKLLDPIVNNWVVAKIGATPSVPLKQLLSAVNYGENMPMEQWLSGFIKNMASPKQTWEEMMKIPYLKTRLGSGYSEAMQRALASDEDIVKSKVSNYHQAFKNLMTIGTRYGDIAAIIYGGKPYLDYLLKQGISEKDAVDKFLQDTLRSQQAPFSSTLSKLQNSKNPFLRALFMFSNTPSQYMRKLFEANQNLRVQRQRYKDGKITRDEYNKVKKQTAKAHVIYGLINTVTFTAMGSIVNAFMRGNDYEDLWKDMLAQLGATYVGGLPIIKDILNTATRQSLGMRVYDDVNPYVEGLDGIITEGIKLSRGESKDPAKSYERIGQSAAEMLGVPFYNIKKDIKAFPPMREETFKETRIKESEDKLNKVKKDDYLPRADAANNIKKAYTKAKRISKKFKDKGKLIQSQKVEDLIKRSKLNLWKGEYSRTDINQELKMFNRQLSEIK